jgi:hypothetical protein
MKVWISVKIPMHLSDLLDLTYMACLSLRTGGCSAKYDLSDLDSPAWIRRSETRGGFSLFFWPLMKISLLFKRWRPDYSWIFSASFVRTPSGATSQFRGRRIKHSGAQSTKGDSRRYPGWFMDFSYSGRILRCYFGFILISNLRIWGLNISIKLVSAFSVFFDHVKLISRRMIPECARHSLRTPAALEKQLESHQNGNACILWTWVPL